jgi:RNA polymerase sigma-70 factor (sigma-E family)
VSDGTGGLERGGPSESLPSDQESVDDRLANSRDRDVAVEGLFFAWYPRLVRTAFGLVGDWALAEQLVQDAFLRLWRRWGWLRDPQAAPAYLHRTVVNLGRAAVRRRVSERRALVRGGFDQLDDSPQSADEPHVAVVLRQAIETLPYRKRACVVLRYLAGLSEAETADALGVSVGTVKSQTHKALRLLREWLDEPAEIAPGGERG